MSDSIASLRGVCYSRVIVKTSAHPRTGVCLSSVRIGCGYGSFVFVDRVIRHAYLPRTRRLIVVVGYARGHGLRAGVGWCMREHGAHGHMHSSTRDSTHQCTHIHEEEKGSCANLYVLTS